MFWCILTRGFVALNYARTRLGLGGVSVRLYSFSDVQVVRIFA